MIQREEIHGALARGYCTPENAHKEVDVALVSAMADEIFALMADHKALVKELVEALEDCLGFVVAHPQFTEDLRNLIAKAKGEA
ncbi:MAG: hypothetical protein WC057_07190 [Dehalococcoidales bacterium]